MDSNRLDELLTRYWACETTLEEEQQLREYFCGEEIPESLKETAALFQYFEETKNKSLSDAQFESKVLAQVTRPKQGRIIRLFYNSMRIAAGVVVVLVATWFIRNEIRQSSPQEIADTYDDPQQAFEETKKALLMISKSFGTAEDQAKKINLFNEAKEEIEKSNDSTL